MTRNRIKRRLRHAARESALQPGMDYIIIASGQVSEVDYTRVQTWLGHALKGVKR